MTEERELVRLLGTRFIQRRDVKAVQQKDGAWYPERTPFTMDDFIQHLAGKKTLGHYLLDQDSLCKLFAFDIDLVKHGQNCPSTGCAGCPVLLDPATLEETKNALDAPKNVVVRDAWLSNNDPAVKELLTLHLRSLAEGLAVAIDRRLGIPVAILNSGGKGLHVYGFTGPIPADAAREAALGILDYFDCFVPTRGHNFFKHESLYPTLEIEVFPKQGSLEKKEYGNLMSLPLGVNQKTGLPKYFVNCRSGLNSIPEMDPTLALDGHQPWE